MRGEILAKWMIAGLQINEQILSALKMWQCWQGKGESERILLCCHEYIQGNVSRHTISVENFFLEDTLSELVKNNPEYSFEQYFLGSNYSIKYSTNVNYV